MLDREGAVTGMGNTAKILLCLFTVVLGVGTAHARFLSSKDAEGLPRGRIGCYPSSTVGTRYPDPFHLGPHSYRYSPWERNGIVYTCRGGHIDITHLRKACDWTAYLAYHIRQTLLSDKAYFSYRMREPSKHYLQFEYPKNWTSLPREVRERIASDVAIDAAEYCTYTGMVWHEILTWLGYKAIGFYTEYPSAFSWEDVYSNLVGCRLAAEALRDPDHEFNEAMTAAINRQLQRLGVQPRPMAWRAGQVVRGHWFVGDFLFCDMVKRNFDIGWDDGCVTPWLVPGVGECGDEAAATCAIPDLSALHGHQFSMKFEIEPREWERKEILRLLYPSGRGQGGRIEPAQHFGPIMEYIRAQAIRRYGPYVDDQSLPLRATQRPPTVKPVQGEGAVSESPILTEASLGMRPEGAREDSSGSHNGYVHPEPATTRINGGRTISTGDILTFAHFWLDEEP
jgi:hypothetical protein